MRKLHCAVIGTILLLVFVSPAWAGHGSHKWKKEDKRKYYQTIRERIHQIRINYQFRALKHRYNKSHADAQQLFLEYIGAAAPDAQAQIEALKAEYEQQIAEKDTMIASLQQQLDDLTTQLNAECDARIGQEQELWQANAQQQLNQLTAEHDAEIVLLTNQMNTACDERLGQAYEEWQAAAQDQCPDTGPLEQVGIFDTVGVTPYAIDRDDSGHIFVLDRSLRNVTEFDATGTQQGQWTSGGFDLPTDIALDTQRNVYVLDRQASNPLQKFTPTGSPMPFDTGTTTIFYPSGLFIDSSDNVYVTDLGGTMGARLLVFDASGALLNTIGDDGALGLDEYNDVAVDETNQLIHIVTNSSVATFDMSGGSMGSWQGDFSNPYGIAVGPNGDIYIADTYNDEIDQYDGTGALKSSFAQDLYRPYRIITDSAGRLYIADQGNRQIKVYE